MKLKNTLFPIAILLGLSTNTSASDRESLFNVAKLTHGGFGGFSTKVTDLNGKTESLGGGKGAWLLNHKTYFGFAAYGTNNEVENTEQQMGYGGLLIGHIFQPKQLFHYNVEMLVGAGSLGNHHQHNHDDRNMDTFSFIEPGANVGVALTRFADLSLGVSYRVVGDTDQSNLSNSDLSGWSMTTSLVFGKF